MSGKYSASSRSSIAAARVHWDAVRARWGWGEIIHTGDVNRGGKLCTFVLELMGHERSPGLFYPSSTISNYVWAVCAFFQEHLQVDPRIGVVGWAFLMSAVTVMTFVPYEPRRRVPTSAVRSALAAVDRSDFRQVQIALLVLMLYFTFQRSEFPCPKTYDGWDVAKHCAVRHMEPHEGGTRWAVGSTKADPRAERLSADAGAGREWIVIGDVDDDLFDMRVWLQLFYSFFPHGPRDPDSPFFVAADFKRPLLYRVALEEFRQFLTGHIDDPRSVGLHGLRSEGFVVCSNAVGEEAAVIQGGWRGLTSASRYDRLTPLVARSMASSMVRFCNPEAQVLDADGQDASSDLEAVPSGSAAGLGISSRRAAARAVPSASSSARAQVSRDVHQPAALPAGWRREWHPTSGRRGGYADFVGPTGRRARSVAEARTLHEAAAAPALVASSAAASARRSTACETAVGGVSLAACASAPVVSVENLVDHVTAFDRPPARPAPRERR